MIDNEKYQIPLLTLLSRFEVLENGDIFEKLTENKLKIENRPTGYKHVFIDGKLFLYHKLVYKLLSKDELEPNEYIVYKDNNDKGYKGLDNLVLKIKKVESRKKETK